MNRRAVNEQQVLNYIISKAITLHKEGERNKLYGAAIDYFGQLHPIGLFPDPLSSPHLLFTERIEFHLQQYLESAQYILGGIGEDVEIFTKDKAGNLVAHEGFMIKLIDQYDIVSKRYIFKRINNSYRLEEFI
jgi:hypothetical protein